MPALRLLQEGGVKVASLAKVPALHHHAVVFWRAWESLNTRRIINEHGPQPVPVSEILAYADLMSVADQDDREDLLYHMNRLDPIYLNHEYERRAKEAKKAKQNQRRSSRRSR